MVVTVLAAQSTFAESASRIIGNTEFDVSRAHYILWSLPRCGSTSLMNIVNAAGGNCCNEPFSNKNFQAPYRDMAIANNLFGAMDDIISKWTGIKHCGHPSGWPFPETMTYLNERILLLPEMKVVMLRRKNMLKQVVSTMIALQCDVWHLHNEADAQRRESFPYRSLDLRQVEFVLERNVRFNEQCDKLIEASGKRFMRVTTEQLFEKSESYVMGYAKLMCCFLGLRVPSDDEIKPMLKQEEKCFSKSIYSKVPEIEEVERRFASLEYGSLYG